MADRLTELALTHARIGITAADRTGPEYMGVGAYQELQRCLPDAELVFCPELFHELTYRKSAEEIEKMSRAGQLAIASLEAVQNTCSEGAREYELAATGTAAVLAGGGRVHLMMIGSTAMDDPRLVYPNPNPSQRLLRDGDVVLTEIAAAYLGYSAKIGHPITLGPPSVGMRKLHDVAVEVLKDIEALLRPGTDLDDVVGAAAGFRRAGVQCRPMVLHGIDLITAGPKVSVGGVSAGTFDRRLAPGMVVNIEATPIDPEGVYGVFLSRTYAIADDGVDCLTPYPVEELLVAG